MSPRDSQMSRLYRAERVALMNLKQQRWGEKSVPAMQAYVDKIVGSAWWRRRYRVSKVTVHNGAGNRRATAHYYSRTIKVPLWARCEWVILHELSHLATDALYSHHNVAHHGREFARVYVELVGHIMGREAADALKAAFREHRVKYSLPRKGRTMTPEQREAAVARLAVARAARGQ